MRKRKSEECWSNIVTMSTREGLLASAFLIFMVRNLRATAVEGEAIGWLVVARSVLGPDGLSAKAEGEVIPSGSAMGEVHR